MEELVYRVHVDSDNPETDRAYLERVRDTFRLITEGLGPYGYTDDESSHLVKSTQGRTK